ncbi:hypothetical protein Mal15_25250 [Stieleria maiorica]|uniref:Uncharacterized protein n=1 Tax=Stieleria maiorica TaxID=2795974 RepID=A0A5B9MCH3_9BACT|nr:hypothetical protein [Stieleria maiorica]QEF98473.1 hypothetical protein Mal15_25250 [Stieleria maiorica]
MNAISLVRRRGPTQISSPNDSRWRHRRARWLALAICLVALPACSKEKLKELADTVQKEGESLVKESKKMTDALVETAEEPLAETGKILLKTPEPLEIDQAVVKVHVVGDGRKHSLQITSYPPGAERTPAPAVFLHATTDVETVALLAGKSLPCNMFVEPRAGAPIARNPIGHPVSVTFESMNMQEKTITATIDACTLIDSNDQPLAIAGGEILAVVEGF